MPTRELVHRPLTSAEWRRLYRQTRGTRPPKGWSCARCEDHMIVEVDGVAQSFMGLLEREVLVNGRLQLIGGLGFGCTALAHERQGYLTQAVVGAVEYFAAQGRPLVLLTCLDALTTFYGTKMGWRPVEVPVHITQPGVGPTVIPPQVVTFAWVLQDSCWPITELDLLGLPW